MRDEWTSPQAPDGTDDGVNQEANNSAGESHLPHKLNTFAETNNPAGDPVIAVIPEWDMAAENSQGLHIERIDPVARGVTPRQVTRGLLVATLIVIIIGGVVSWPALARMGGPLFTHARQALFPTPPAPRVWQPISPSYAQSVAFGVNAPETGYLCGEATPTQTAPTAPPATPVKGYNPSVPPSADDLRAITLGVSADGGRSWRTVATPAHGSGCAISVNPSDARDIVLLALVCALCDATQVHTFVWRSRDGGRSWSAIPPPADPGVAPSDATHPTTWPLYVQRATWAGAALYLAAYPGLVGKARLAVCLNSATCSWVDLGRALVGEPAGLTVTPLSIEGVKNTLYMQLTAQDSCPPACVRDVTSSDGGATWAPFAPTFRGQPIQPIPESHGAPDLLGYYQAPGADDETLLSSSDGGATWRIRQPTPTALYTQQLLETPDGTIFAWLTRGPITTNAAPGQNAQQGIYALAPTGGQWRLVAPEQTSQTIAILALSCDAHGHAQAIWGNDLSLVGVAQPAVLVHWL